MKIIGVACGPIPGQSAGLVKEVLRGAEEAGHQTVYISGKFSGCMGCHACKKNENGACVLKDALSTYFEELPDADAVVFGAGNYMGWPQGQAWDFVHRHFRLSKGSRSNSGCYIPAGKKLIPIFAQGVPVVEMYKERYEQFLSPFKDWGFVTEEILVTCGPKAEEMKQKAYEIGKNL